MYFLIPGTRQVQRAAWILGCRSLHTPPTTSCGFPEIAREMMCVLIDPQSLLLCRIELRSDYHKLPEFLPPFLCNSGRSTSLSPSSWRGLLSNTLLCASVGVQLLPVPRPPPRPDFLQQQELRGKRRGAAGLSQEGDLSNTPRLPLEAPPTSP